MIVSVLSLLVCLGTASHVQSSADLGTVHVPAWLTQPRMPAISISRGPLQQIIDVIHPETVRPIARAWESEVSRHRRLNQAVDDTLARLNKHFQHQILVRPDEVEALQVSWKQEQKRLYQRFSQEFSERVQRLRSFDTEILTKLQRCSLCQKRVGPAYAAGQVLLAEITWTQYRDHQRDRQLKGMMPSSDTLSSQKLGYSPGEHPLLERPLSLLKKALKSLPNRLTRERASQLLAMCQVEQSLTNEAIETLEDVVSKNVSWILEAELHNRLGDLLLKQGRYSRAAKAYSAVTATAGSWYTRARVGLAWTRHRRGDDKSAMVAINEVRAKLGGLIDRSARDLISEVERLYIQLLADETNRAQSTVSPRIMAAVHALRATDGRPEQRQSRRKGLNSIADDGRRQAVVTRIPGMRQCYRRLLRTRENAQGHVVLSFVGAAPPSVLRSALGGKRFNKCLTGALRDIVPLPTDRTAMLEIVFHHEAKRRD